jgi:hypothetical protein
MLDSKVEQRDNRMEIKINYYNIKVSSSVGILHISRIEMDINMVKLSLLQNINHMML